MYSKLDKRLFSAVLEPRKSGAISLIRTCCDEGANPNLVTIETSTSMGHVQAGHTLLTFSVHEGNSRAVEALLDCGADVNLADELGWTPWMASTVAFDKRDIIQEILLKNEANQDGAYIGDLIRAISDGNTELAKSLFTSEKDLIQISNFRVDLLRHQLRNKQTDMFLYLLEVGMPIENGLLYWAVTHQNLAAVEAILESGVHPDKKGRDETLLMLAASLGDQEIAQKLIEFGADVNRYVHDNIQFTAELYAEKAKHKELAKWLRSQMSNEFLSQQKAVIDSYNVKFKNLYKNGTSGENVTTDDIVKLFEQWDGLYTVKVKRSDHCSLTLEFESLPDNIDKIIKAAQKICPDGEFTSKKIKKNFTEKRQLNFWWD